MARDDQHDELDLTFVERDAVAEEILDRLDAIGEARRRKPEAVRSRNVAALAQDAVVDGARVRGTATLGRKYVGPPGAVHGGTTAMIADQLLSLVPPANGLSMVTRSMRVDYLRPTPLDTPLELEAWCEGDPDDSARALCEIRAKGKVTVRGEGDLVRFVMRKR